MAIRFSCSSLLFGSIPTYSIHIRSLLFFERCVPRRCHGVVSVHGCSPRYTLHSIGHFCWRGVDILEGCSEDFMYLSFLSFINTLFLYLRSYDHLLTYIVFIFFIYVDVCFFHLPLHVLFLFSLYAHAS